MNYGYWPRGVTRALTIEAFAEAFQTLGYERCGNGARETHYEKIVIYALDGEPTHAARQLPDGRWSSKLGKGHDLTHTTVRGVEGPLYGKAVLYMRRPLRRGAPASLPTPTAETTGSRDADDGPAPVD
jgi:hypothetical protein